MHPVRLGTCGWSYKDWAGVFYPSGLASADYLSFYATRYQVVEVDATYYRPPSPRTVEGWHEKTPPGFGFSLKVPQTITHEKVLANCQDDVASFLGAARRLGDKLLSCLLQFPYFNRTRFRSLEEFLARLEPFLCEWPPDVPLAVEVRNRAWMKRPLADLLRRHRAVLVLPDQAWMPPLAEVLKSFDVVTGAFAYVRLLGDREAVDARTDTLNRLVLDRSAEVSEDAAAIKELQGRVPVLAFVNNHYAGYAPATLLQLAAQLGEAA